MDRFMAVLCLLIAWLDVRVDIAHARACMRTPWPSASTSVCIEQPALRALFARVETLQAHMRTNPPDTTSGR